jgi:membrane-bound lytic murein transglycosylase D
MKKYLVILVSLVVTTVQAQQILVPDNVYFADIHLSIDASAREKIQKNVDALLKHPTYFQQKVDRADTYFPIITRVFLEAGLPEDFKYLALQESGLVPDAISTSKAEGFWQFKKETALDYGLAINPNVDERRHIIEASRGAAKYFVQSNAYYKNWVNSLVSYYMGFTGAKVYARPSDTDSKDMRITDQTHIYFLTFLAHKIAFENFVGKNPKPAISLKEMRATPGLSLNDIALANQTNEAELLKYNRWLLGSTVPADKDYTVFIPVTGVASEVVLASAQPTPAPAPPQPIKTETVMVSGKKVEFATLNGLKVIIAQAGDTKDKLALQARISTKKFLKLNDMYSFEQIVPGKPYYLEKKRSRANVEYHTAQNGETLVDIAQIYGMRVKSIISKNRMKKNESLLAGRVLWLQQTRPANIAAEYRRVEAKPTPSKTPQPLKNPETIAQNENQNTTKTSSEVLTTIKETASNTFHKAGHAINIPEKQREVAQVGTDVFEEAIELNPKTQPVVTAEPTASNPITTASAAPETKTTEVKSEEIVPATTTKPSTENLAIVKTEVAKPIISDSLAQTITLKDNSVVATAPTITSDSTVVKITETPKVLYPKKTNQTQTVALQEPAETTEKPTEKMPVIVAEAPVNPKVVLKDPTPVAGPKTVSIPAKKAEPKTEKPATHKVTKGQTIYAIAKKYNVSPSDLKYWNKLDEKPLAIGQELALTGESQPVQAILTLSGPDQPVAEGTVVTITHKVGEGESMYQISRKYGVSIKEIMEWNKKSDFNVSAGDELTIRSRPGSSRN